jgi:hypothetical protein
MSVHRDPFGHVITMTPSKDRITDSAQSLSEGSDARMSGSADTRPRATRLAKDGGWSEPPGPATELTVEVIPPPVSHVVRVADVMRWLDGVAADPAAVLEKVGLKRIVVK